jgi:transketolase
MRGAVRLASLMDIDTIYVWTHDSIGLGEDGPTHQPIEHLAALRAMPDLTVLRPADANETAAAWRIAIERQGPIALSLSRQDLPVLEGTFSDGVARGAYVLRAVSGRSADLVLIGTGGEVWVCVEAAERLVQAGIATQVVSMPCWELFAEQSDRYQDDVLPPDVPTLAVEAGVSFGWDRWADAAVTVDRFGASAPGREALERLGFTAENVVARAHELLDDLS